MSSREWLKILNALLDVCEATDGDASELRNILFGLYRLLERGDQSVQTAYENLSEDDLNKDARLKGESLSSGKYSISNRPTALAPGVRIAANLLRSVEQAIVGLGGFKSPRRAEELVVRYNEHQGWLLPYPPRFRGEPKDWPPYFAKRALRHFRCLSRELGTGHRVNLKWLDAEFGAELVSAGCLFDQIRLLDQNGIIINDKSHGPLVISGIEGRDAAAVETAVSTSCRPDAAAQIIVFPELTVTPEERLRIAKTLSELRGHRPSIVVGGSWHDEREDGKFENRAPVFDASGRLIDHHVKVMTYGSDHSAGLIKEDIVVGEEILVVATTTLTLAIAICLDFCQSARPNPYDELDVDLVLVTSLANAKTTDRHGKQAERIWDRRKTGTFLAQQDEIEPFGVTGARPNDGGFASPAATQVAIRKIVRPS